MSKSQPMHENLSSNYEVKGLSSMWQKACMKQTYKLLLNESMNTAPQDQKAMPWALSTSA